MIGALRSSAVFLGVTFSVSWGLWFLLILGTPLPRWYYYLAALGPALGTLAALGFQGGLGAIRSWFLLRLGHLGPGRLWGLVLGGLTGTIVVGVILEALFFGSLGALKGLGTTAELPGWSPLAVAVLLTLSFGFCEEWGWRGWLFPHWSAFGGPRKAALAVGAVWSLWHLPAFFCNPTYQTMGWAALGWAFSLIAGSVLLAWMVVQARGSLWPVVVWHSVFDFVTVSDSSGQFLAPALSVAVLAAVPLVWNRFSQPLGGPRGDSVASDEP